MGLGGLQALLVGRNLAVGIGYALCDCWQGFHLEFGQQDGPLLCWGLRRLSGRKKQKSAGSQEIEQQNP